MAIPAFSHGPATRNPKLTSADGERTIPRCRWNSYVSRRSYAGYRDVVRPWPQLELGGAARSHRCALRYICVHLAGVTLAALVFVWGAFTLADGILSLVAAFKVRDQGKPFWSLLIVGLLGIAAGIVTFLWPGMAALLLVVFIGAWAFLMGIFQIVAAIRLRREIEGEVAAGAVGPAVDAVRAVRLLAARRRRARADLGHRRLRDLLWHAC